MSADGADDDVDRGVSFRSRLYHLYVVFFVLLFIVFCLFMNVGEDLHVELHGVVYQFAANVEQSKVKVNDFIILARIRRNNPKVRFSILNLNHSNLTVGFRHGQNRVS